MYKIFSYLNVFFKPKLFFFVHTDGVIYKAPYMNIQISDSQKVTLTVAETSKAGNPVPTSDVVSFVSSDTSVVAVNATGATTAEAVATGKVGTATVTANVGNFVATAEIAVVAGAVAGLTISADAPVEK